MPFFSGKDGQKKLEEQGVGDGNHQNLVSYEGCHLHPSKISNLNLDKSDIVIWRKTIFLYKKSKNK